MELLAIALFLAVVNTKIVDYIAVPLKQRYPAHDFWWLLYAALVSGFLIGWYSGINLFAPYLPDPLVGRILTAVLIGGGSSLIHDIFQPQPDVVIEAGTIEAGVQVGDTIEGDKTSVP